MGSGLICLAFSAEDKESPYRYFWDLELAVLFADFPFVNERMAQANVSR